MLVLLIKILQNFYENGKISIKVMKMVKKYIKSTGIILIFFLIINILAINSKVCAAGIDVTEDLDYWSNLTVTDTAGSFHGMAENVISIVRVIGIIASLATLSIIGIKFMLGSVEEKAQYKQTLFPWFIGALLVFAITTLPTIIYEATNGALSK